MLAPIVLFAFNRPESLKLTLNSLKNNPEAKDSDLFIFVDGPRNEEEKKLTDKTIEVAKKTEGFKNIRVKASNHNKGLGDSIISGVSEVINEYGIAIVLEDDLILQPNFLSFINQGLKQYSDDKKIFSVCGYTNKIRIPKDYPYDAYLCTRSSSWGWATWKERWNSVDWKLENWESYRSKKKAFNKWGGSDCYGMLEGWKKGLNNSWAIRFCFSQFLQDKLAVFPIKSLVQNEGFDGAGTNCKKWSRFKYELMNPNKYQFSFPTEISMNDYLFREAIKYHSIPIRVFSKIMYIINK